MRFSQMTLQELLDHTGQMCACGKPHTCALREVALGHGVVAQTPDILRRHGIHRPFVVCDANTYGAAMAEVESALNGAGMTYTVFNFGPGRLEPDERAVGALIMAFDRRCDGVLAVGSGVINDCCKVLAHAAGLPSIVVGTAPSMDGYASGTASMVQNRVKVSLTTGCPVAIIADTAIMKNAPMRMLQAGYGDMIAKYSAICEWRISAIMTGEPYCEEIAEMVRASLRQVVEAADRLPQRDEEAVRRVVGGLILCGIAMAFAGLSRPASGEEHYFSHMWEMMDLERGKESDLHGIQVGVGTLLTLRVFDWLRQIKPDRAHAEAMMRAFSQEQWRKEMQRIFGKAAQAIIEGEETRYHKNDPQRHAEHWRMIAEHWEDFLRIMDEELPDAEALRAQMKRLGMPMTPEDIGVSRQDVEDAWIGSREIRDKYLCSSLVWDLGRMRDATAVLV